MRELYESGLTQGQVALQLNICVDTVRRDLRSLGVQSPTMARTYRHVTPLRPVQLANPTAPAVAFSAARGWHVVDAPPAWALDMLANLD